MLSIAVPWIDGQAAPRGAGIPTLLGDRARYHAAQCCPALCSGFWKVLPIRGSRNPEERDGV